MPAPPSPRTALFNGPQACLPIFETCLHNRIDHGGGPIGVEYLTMALTYEHYGEAARIFADLSGAEPSVVKVMVMHRPRLPHMERALGILAGQTHPCRRGWFVRQP